MESGQIDKKSIKVTMNMEEYEYYKAAERGRNELIKMLERANENGKATMTEELKKAIEEIYS